MASKGPSDPSRRATDTTSIPRAAKLTCACGRQRFIAGYRVRLLRRGRCSIQFAVALLDASGAEMALHSDADMVRSIVGARQVKLLSGPTGSKCQDALA